MHRQIYSQVKKLAGNTSISVLLLIVLFAACLIGLYAIVDMVFEDNNYALDQKVFEIVAPYYSSPNTALMQGISFFGSQNFLLPANIILILVAFLKENNKWNAIKIASISISSTAVMFLLKFILQRQRPIVPLIVKAHGYSFPSGHTFTSLCFFGMLMYIVYKKIKQPATRWTLIVIMILLVLLVGFSRVYLKLHYASDVIAGFCLGIIWLLLAKWFLFKAQQKTGPGNIRAT